MVDVVLVVVRVDRVSLASRRGRASAAPRTHISRHKTSASASERAFSVDFLGSCHKKFPPYLTILHTKKSKITITITTDHLDHRPSLSPRRPPPPHPNNPMTMMGRKQHTAAALALIAVASSMRSAVAFSASQLRLSPTSYAYRASTSIFAESTSSSSPSNSMRQKPSRKDHTMSSCTHSASILPDNWEMYGLLLRLVKN